VGLKKMTYHYTKGLPTLFEIHKCVPEINSEPELEAFLTKTIRQSGETMEYKNLLIMLETLLKYRMIYILEEYSELIEFTLFGIELANYRQYRYLEQARRKIDYKFRLNARKKYIDYIISNSELGRDVSSVICSFL